MVGDTCLGMLEAVGEVFPETNTNENLAQHLTNKARPGLAARTGFV
ncbi:MAG TPA: hypothetical protein IAA58_06770 [Candidatus Gallacutalibacter stercoravium]|nr:hypothetical protein [Candidatus Gallacutalibacter stercoravium]